MVRITNIFSPSVKQVFFSTAAILNTLTLGMLYGYPTILNKALLDKHSDLQTDEQTATWISSIPGISGVLAVILLGLVMHKYGRKPAHIVATVPVLLGWIATLLSYNIETLIIARTLVGFNKGGLYLYSICIGELTSPKLRGVTLGVKTFSVTAGIALIHLFGYFFPWRTLALVGIVPSAIALLITIFWPETPEWLVSKGKYEEAEIAYFALRGYNNETEEEIKVMIEAEITRRMSDEFQKRNFRDVLNRLRSRVLWRPMGILFAAMILIEAGGKHFFPSYSVQLAGQITGDNSKGYIYTLIVDAIFVSGAFASNFLIRRYPRRRLLFVSGYSSVVLLFLTCILMLVKEEFYQSDVLTWIAVALLGLYFLFIFGGTFAVSLGLNGELLPLEYRDIGTVIVGISSSILLAVTMKIIPLMNFYLNVYGMFFVFCLLMTLCLTYMYIDLPETKDRTLHDIGLYFKGESPKVLNKDVTVKSVDVKP